MDVRERELDDLFYKFGRITGIQIKRMSRPPCFAFISFRDPRDARDAVRYRDGCQFAGGRIRVEIQDATKRRGWRDGGLRSAEDERRKKRPRNGTSESYRGGGKRDDSDGSHDDTVGHYNGKRGDFIEGRCE